MSGKKDSHYRLDRERTAREHALRSIRVSQQLVAGLQHQLQGMLSQPLSAVQLSTKNRKNGEAWLAVAQRSLQDSQSLSLSSQSLQTTNVANDLQRIVNEGNRHVAVLAQDIRDFRQQLRVHQTAFEGCMAQLSAQESILRQWQSSEWDALQTQATQVRQYLEAQDLAKTKSAVEQLKPQLKRAIAQAEQRETENFRQESAQAFFGARREVQLLVAGVANSLTGLSQGMTSTFPSEVENASRWRREAESVLQNLGNLGPDATAAQFKSATEQLEAMRPQGNAVSGALSEAVTERADSLRQQSAAHLERLESTWDSARDVLYLWLAPDELDAMEAELKRLRSRLNADWLLEIEEQLPSFEQALPPKLAQAEAQEEKHTRRLFLLDALRRVCGEMGFGEVEPPAFEREGDRSSRIRLEVDTYDRGRVTFHLSLDKIEADSCIRSENCPNEFESLSKHLKDEYGVQTEFRLADGEPLNKLLTDDGAQLPESNEMAMNA